MHDEYLMVPRYSGIRRTICPATGPGDLFVACRTLVRASIGIRLSSRLL